MPRDTARIEGIVARLHGLYPRLIDLDLDRLRRLLAALGSPETKLPPVIHVAGTNGKGSTCAFLRAIGEAAGLRVHVYISPHLVHFSERIRIAGELVSDKALGDALEEVERINEGAPITVFEVITAVAFLLFSRTLADLCVLEVGLGGRGDATNVIARPAACAITSISLDHRDLLGDTLAAIAAEKAGIIKPRVPVAIGDQPEAARAVLLDTAERLGAPALLRDRDWTIETVGGRAIADARASVRHARECEHPRLCRTRTVVDGRLSPTMTMDGMRESDRHTVGGGLIYTDAQGTLELPMPALPGAHQYDNAGIAIAALRASGLALPADAFGRGLAAAEWPARLQWLQGRLAAMLPADWELWLDGGHNEGAARALAAYFASAWSDRPLHLVIGMKQSKDTATFLDTLLPFAASAWAVCEPGQHLGIPVDDIVRASGGRARPGPHVADALAAIARSTGGPARVLICGSLYLAGEVLKLDAGP